MKATRGVYKALIGAAALAAGMTGANASSDFLITYGTTYSRPLYVGGSSLWNGNGAYISGFQADWVGGDALPANHSDPFLTFCIDASYTLKSSGKWQVGFFPNPNPGSPAWQEDGIYRAASLYNHYVSGVSVKSADESASGNYASLEAAALQLAIWEVLYESSSVGYNVTSGTGFKVGGTATSLETMANAYLASSWNIVDDNITTTFWNAVDPGNNQDLIGPFMPIPEPGTVLGGLMLVVPLLVGGARRLRGVRAQA